VGARGFTRPAPASPEPGPAPRGRGHRSARGLSSPAQMCPATRGTLLTSLALRGESEDLPGLKVVAPIEQAVRSGRVQRVT